MTARGSSAGLDALIAALRAHGGTLAETLLVDPPTDDRPPGAPQQAAAGPRAAGREAEYELLLEMILEGSLLHYGAPRVLRDADRDLSLLLGDQLYALGLSRLAALGDLEAVAELADLISLVATAHAAEQPALAEAVWRAGAAAIGWGSSSEHEAAKALARGGDSQALRAFETVATSVGS